MPLSTNTAGLTLIDEDDDSTAKIYAAKAAGYKFIEVHLKPNVKLQGTGRISGAMTLRVWPDGLDHNNVPKFAFKATGGDIQFAFDNKKFVMYASVLDDNEKGVVSEVGYNRDLLATHLDLFDIPDPEIAADIKSRAELYKAKALQAEAERQPEPDLELYAAGPIESVSEIDRQIAMLQRRKDAALGAPPTQPAKTEPPKAKKTRTVAQMKNVQKMQAARKANIEKRKAEAKAAADKPKEATGAEHETNSEVATA